MSSMFPPIDEDTEMLEQQTRPVLNNQFDIAAALGMPLQNGITAEDLQTFFMHSRVLHTGREKLPNVRTIEHVIELIDKSSKILVLTGAGISVSAGIPDFRSEDGLYATLKDKFHLDEPSSMFDINYFLKDPSLFYSFGGDICPGFDDTKIKYYPTAAHYFIKLLESKGKLLRNYTQNIDTLEIRAGIENVIACHGSYLTASCISCEFQVHGMEIESYIFKQQIPYCPYCRPKQSQLKHLMNSKGNGLRASNSIISTSASGHLLQVRLPNVLCSMDYLEVGCPILFSFDESALAKAIFDDEEIKDKNNVNMNYKTLFLKSSRTDIIDICRDALQQWLQTDIASFGVLKPDIVFFSESLSTDYHNTLDEDIQHCDLLLVLGTSLQVQPVSTIPKRIPSQVPAVLINREVVGYPNKFDVYMLGNCDDIVTTLCHKLQWQFMKAKQIEDEDENEKEENQSKESMKTYTMKPIETVKCEINPSKYEFVKPNYYVFPNGKLPDDVNR